MAKRIHFINVSKFDNIGDCILIEINDTYVLIDCGEGGTNYGQNTWIDHEVNGVVVPGTRTYLKKVMKNNNFFYVFLSHSHSDHIGAFAKPTGEFIRKQEGLISLVREDERLYVGSEWNVVNIVCAPYSDESHLLPEYLPSQKYDNQEMYTNAANGARAMRQLTGKDWHFQYFSKGTYGVGPISIIFENLCATLLDGKPQSDENIWSYVYNILCEDNNKKVALLGDYQNDIVDSYNNVSRYNLEKHLTEPRLSLQRSSLLKLGHHGLVNSGHDWTLRNLAPKCIINSGPLNLLTTHNGIAGKYWTDEKDPDGTPVGYQRFLTADEIGAPIVSTTGEVYFKGTTTCIQNYPEASQDNRATFPQYCDAVVWDFADEIDPETMDPNCVYIHEDAEGKIHVNSKFDNMLKSEKVVPISYEGTTRTPGKNYDRVIYNTPNGKNIIAAAVKVANEDDENDRAVVHAYKDALSIQSYNEGPDDGAAEGRKFKVEGRIIVED